MVKSLVMLAESLNDKSNVVDWVVSEKLDGIRAIYVDGKMITRTGKEIKFPGWFIKDFPSLKLDGELWVGRQKFQSMGIVRHKEPVEEDWKKVKYMVFDVFVDDKIYKDRLDILRSIKETDTLKIVKTWTCDSKDQLLKDQAEYEANGAEGLIVRNPNSLYEYKRSKNLLKVKTTSTSEAVVIGYTEGQGRLDGMIGALIVKNENGKEFKLGTGLDDEHRSNLKPEVGSVVTYAYNELTDDGIPRFPRFIAVRSNYE